MPDDIRFRIAAARRILARNGCESMVAGHVSARAADGEDAFWVSPFEYFDESMPDHVVKTGFDLRVREGDWEPSPAIHFHAAFYQARPDAKSVIHTHSHYVSVLSTTRRPIGMYNVVSVLFHDDQALYEDDGSRPPVDDNLMTKALGSKRVLLIKNHGADHRFPVAGERHDRSADAREVRALPHRSRGHRRAREFPEVEVRRGRDAYHKYFLPNMWEANLRRLRRSDPDLFE